MDMGNEQQRVLLLMSPATYRAGAFLSAARSLNLEVVVGIDLPETLSEYWHVPLGLDFAKPDESVRTIVEFHRKHPIQAIIAVDDSATELAARAGTAIGLAHNSPHSAEAARDKLLMRTLMSAGGAPCPIFRPFLLNNNPDVIASQVSYPCVVKPLRLSGSRGVIRANNPAEFSVAFNRLKRLLISEGNSEHETSILVEDFIPGYEVALEGLLTHSQLKVLALFDKPDPLDGPFFEETIYTTPSRLPDRAQAALGACARDAVTALGLREGPVHAELRWNERGPWLIELAARSIGGRCSAALRFEAGETSLEELIIRHALGMPLPSLEREHQASGVMMIPVPGAGVLREVRGLATARAVPLIEDVVITAHPGQTLLPWPEGWRYPGFIFARGETPEAVEAALRTAQRRLGFVIE